MPVRYTSPAAATANPVGTSGLGPTRGSRRVDDVADETKTIATIGRNARPVSSGEKARVCWR